MERENYKKFNYSSAQTKQCRCLRYYSDADTKLVILIFVDDGLTCCNDSHCIDKVLSTMNDVFETKVNDPEVYIAIIKFFLGLNKK